MYNMDSSTHNLSRFIVIGISDAPDPYFPPEVQCIIRNGHIFSGGERHHSIVAPLLPTDARWITVSVPLDNVFRQYNEVDASQTIIVFASGDPLFFGFANTLRRRMPEATIRLYPSFNSLQTLAHRLVMPYDDMRTVSLTGRPWQEFDRALIERAPKIGVLTDREHTPDAIARRMIDYGYTYYTLYIGEHLGNPQHERISRLTPETAAKQRFEHPNNLILVADKQQLAAAVRPFGIPDEMFRPLNGRTGMITKAPIRLLTLQALSLERSHVFWDIGFCTGSVSIEARLQFPHLSVVSFEIRPEGEELMQQNAHRLGAPGIQAFICDFLATDLDGLPRPDAVFIGGHGGKLVEMMERLRNRLLPGGCVVLNAVSEHSRSLFEEGAQLYGYTLHPSLHVCINDYNPIDIMKATI